MTCHNAFPGLNGADDSEEQAAYDAAMNARYDARQDHQRAYEDSLRVVCTCGAWPEQYEVFDGDRQVGYIRFRWGVLRVDCPDSGGETVHDWYSGDDMQGCGLSPAQLRRAIAAIARWAAREADNG